jgi:hypothetical protein
MILYTAKIGPSQTNGTSGYTVLRTSKTFEGASAPSCENDGKLNKIRQILLIQ